MGLKRGIPITTAGTQVCYAVETVAVLPARTAVFNISSPLGLTTPQKYSIFKRL